MPDRFAFLPFMLATTIPGAKVNVARIVEALVIAALTGAVSVYGVTKVLETKIVSLEQRLTAVEIDQKALKTEILCDIREVRGFIQTHVASSITRR